MRAFADLTEALESRPDDADRVAVLARHLRAAGRAAGCVAAEWLVPAGHGARSPRPAPLTRAALAAAAAPLAAAAGMAPWLFDAGCEASAEATEAIAMLLPWPDRASGAPPAAARPALADWLAAWRAAAATEPAHRARAIAATIARLDDPLSRRWAVRAVCGLVRPVVSEWQWQRAWAEAFDGDPQATAWAWHRRPGAGFADFAGQDAEVPRPEAFAPLPEAPEAAHDALLAAWREGDVHAEPRWRGVRVQIVRRGAELAVWQRAGRLLNAVLPEALVAAAGWPEDSVIEAVLLAWRDGRNVPVAELLAAPPNVRKPAARRAAPAAEAVPTVPTLHLALTDWHRWPGQRGAALDIAQRRARLRERWPAPAIPMARAAPPAVFTTPELPVPAAIGAHGHASELAALASGGRDAGWSGLLLRRRGAAGSADAPAWGVRATVLRVRAVLQYVPGEALGARAASALAGVDCGFALWNRAPLSPDERRAAMTAALAGEFLPPPADATGVAGLRLLPVARLPIALPDDVLQRLHAWLRANAGLRFGGVHAVAPVQVFELGFEQVRPSARRRIGVQLDGARVLRWLPDAPPGDAQCADELG